ncbi:MAG: branched-chain amino acid ABC transporter permease [Ilumatobacteraceae bacterium]
MLLGLLLAIFIADAAGAQQSDEGAGIQGTLTYEPEDEDAEEKLPVEGATLIVYEAQLSSDGRSVVELGEAVGEGVTDAEGVFGVDLPGGGDFAIELQVDTLPEGVALVDEDRQTLAIQLNEGQRRNVLFNLAEGDAGGGRQQASTFDRAARLFVEGIKYGLIIGMCAVGLSLIYGTTGLVNFAHSEMITLGAVFAFFFNVTIGIQLIPAVLLAMVLGGFFGAGLDLVIWRPLRRRGVGLVAMMIISIGMAILLRYAILYQFGDRSRPYDDYAVQTDPLIEIGPVDLVAKDVLIIVLSVVVLIGVAMGLRLTKLGKAMRAVSDSPDLAASTGIDVNRIITTVWFLGGVLVTLGGVFVALSEQVNWLMGQQLLLLVFAGVTLGGLGTDFGAMAGSLIVGVLVYMSTLYLAPELRNVGALLVLILILMVRPQGLFGRRERIG